MSKLTIDTDKIAEIIKLDNLDLERVKKAGHSKETVRFYEGMNTAIQNKRSQLIQLADYFEKEEHEKRIKFTQIQNLRMDEVPSTFNRTQFLKKAGVNEK